MKRVKNRNIIEICILHFTRKKGTFFTPTYMKTLFYLLNAALKYLIVQVKMYVNNAALTTIVVYERTLKK